MNKLINETLTMVRVSSRALYELSLLQAVDINGGPEYEDAARDVSNSIKAMTKAAEIAVSDFCKLGKGEGEQRTKVARYTTLGKRLYEVPYDMILAEHQRRWGLYLPHTRQGDHALSKLKALQARTAATLLRAIAELRARVQREISTAQEA